MRTVRTRKQVTPEQALVRLEELCVRAERCVQELLAADFRAVELDKTPRQSRET